MVGLQAVSVRCLDQTVVREATPRDEKHMYFFFNTRNKADKLMEIIDTLVNIPLLITV